MAQAGDFNSVTKNNDAARDEGPQALFVRPANGGDTYFLIGILQDYGNLISGTHFQDVKNFLDSEIKNTMVAVARGGEIVGFGINDKHPDIDNNASVVLLYTRQTNPDPTHAEKLIRAFALTALAKASSKDQNPKLPLLVDREDAITASALENIGAGKGRASSKMIHTLIGLRKMNFFEIDNLAEKFTRQKPQGAKPSPA